MDVNQRAQAISDALALYESQHGTRTLNIDFRGQSLDLPVVVIPPTVALLNHDNNRLTAQLMDHPKQALVQQNPLSPEAQEVVEALLAATLEFNQLKDEIKQVGQKDPGLITRDGLLINGNTRAVALRELNAEGMLVALLPEGILPSDIIALEVDLQMVKKTHQDYTFTNQLLLLDRLKSSYTNSADLAKRMNWLRNGAKKVAQSARMLSIINDVRALVPAHAFPYSFFDTKAEHLKNLDDEYQKLLASGDLEDAEQMKWSRLSAMLLGVAKDQVREIDEDFITDEVAKRIVDPTALALLRKDGESESDGLEDLLGEEKSEFDPKKFARILVEQKLGVTAVSSEQPQRVVLDDIETAFRLAAEDRITQQKLENYLAEPSDVLRETRISLERILEKYDQISATSGFDRGKFGFELAKVVKVIADLDKKYKSIPPR